MNKADLIKTTSITRNILAKIGEGDLISMDSLKKFCTVLEYDIMTFDETLEDGEKNEIKDKL